MVVNTHSHYDHIAQNHLFDNVSIFDAPSARQAAKNGCSSEVMLPLLGKGMLWKPLPVDFDSAHYHVPPFTVARWLSDGDLIDLGNRSLEAIHTPGHSQDSICLLDRDARLLWTGDTYYPGPIYLHLPGSHLDEFIESYEKILTLSEHYDMLIPSHNEPYVRKEELSKVLNAAKDIRLGNGKYVERTENGTKIRRYDYPGFAIITGAPATEVNGE
jgi:glyoxylase-like metal-dependent hydrolase (beta-lactamase superfamily II)